MREDLWVLPKTPGVVIAIGEWWFVRLRSYEGAQSAWEMLPLPSKEWKDAARRNGVADQCVYDDAWVMAEADQEGGYLVISEPVDKPYGPTIVNADHRHRNEPESEPLKLLPVAALQALIAARVHENNRLRHHQEPWPSRAAIDSQNRDANILTAQALGATTADIQHIVYDGVVAEITGVPDAEVKTDVTDCA